MTVTTTAEPGGARIVSAGAYLPVHRLSREEIGRALGVPAGRGTRTVASYDEDTTSMGVAAARRALAAWAGPRPGLLTFATTVPAYADKTNATAIHAALGLDQSVAAYDMVGSMRSGLGALRAAADGARAGAPGLAVLADLRTGLPGSADEREGGDGAAAFVFATDGPCLAEVVAHEVATAEFLDRWRVPGEPYSRVWEERFGEAAYAPLAEAALTAGLKAAGIGPDDVDHLVVTGTPARAVRTVAKRAGVAPEAVVDDRSAVVGVAGAAHPGLLLADVLDRAKPGQAIVLLVLADGAECVVLRGGELLAGTRPSPTVAAQLEGMPVGYQQVLTWRGFLRREPPRRPDPERPAAPPALRNAAWKFGFVAGRCTACGTRHLPPERVCLECRAVDRMVPEPLADVRATVTTFTIDHLAFSVAPPVVAAVVDIDGGGRLQCELTDVDPATVAVGDRVELVFRRLYTTADGVHDYFWKARPVRAEEG